MVEVCQKDEPWFAENLAIFSAGYSACKISCSEYIPPLPLEVRGYLVNCYRLAVLAATIKNKGLLGSYIGCREIQTPIKGDNFFPCTIRHIC